MEIRYPYYFSYIVSNTVSDSISVQAGNISREEMIERYFYPEDDLLGVDLDWM
jgi:hypothetical protein